MGRRGNPPPRRQSTLSPAVVHRRIESCKISHLSFDDIADHLYSSFPDYKHYKLIPFRTKIRQLLQSRRPNRFQSVDDGGDEEESLSAEVRSPSRKKQRQIDDDRERKLVGRENDHLQMRRENENENSSSSGSTSSSEAEVSISEDAIFEEDVKPEFDLMKSMLRAGYGDSKSTPNSKAKSKAVIGEEKNVEMEDVRREKKVSSGALVRGEKSSSEVVEERELKGRVGGKGPRFRDFGGIKNVLEQLRDEVIVPFHRPELPEWLGVKPISGILLHGPPGCGKTQLARAIANETGVPFYQISATEVVSGVSGITLLSF